MVAPPTHNSALRSGRPLRAGRMCAFALATLAFLATGCGGGDDPVHVTGGILRLDVDEYRVLPTKVTVPAGRMKILIHNVGKLTHNVHVEDPSRLDDQGNPFDLGGTPTAHPGTGPMTREAATLTLAPGTYRLVCTIANHEVLGQYAALVVK